ncbi:MAG: hypothetical protein WAT67_12480 [Candidatus Contendobacter sp.]
MNNTRKTPLTRLGCLLSSLAFTPVASAVDLPACLPRIATETTQAATLRARPSAQELLARLTYAESRSTGFADEFRVYRGIAWGVMNRVRLGEISPTARRQYGHGISGVIFQSRQFNPAVSLRSSFSRDFLCPQQSADWNLAMDAAATALRGQENPFLQTPWEQHHGRSLVVNFYYPSSPQAHGPLAPWEGSRTLRFIGDPPPGSDLPNAQQVRFYRLAQPPRDIPEHPGR